MNHEMYSKSFPFAFPFNNRSRKKCQIKLIVIFFDNNKKKSIKNKSSISIKKNVCRGNRVREKMLLGYRKNMIYVCIFIVYIFRCLYVVLSLILNDFAFSKYNNIF